MPSSTPEAKPTQAAAPAVVAALEHMTGPSRGETDWVVADETEVRIAPTGELALAAAGDPEPAGVPAALMLHREGGYILDLKPGQQVWINGALAPPGRRRLEHGDVVEFGEAGPISRLSLYQQGGRPHHTAAAILSDVAAYFRVSRRPLPIKAGRAISSLVRRLIRETTLLFRIAVFGAIGALILVVYRQDQLADKLELQLATEAQRLDSFRAALARSRREALTPADLNALSQELQQGLTTAAGRLAALEARSKATATVIAAAAPSVAFLQGAYGYRHGATGQMLRHVPGPDGLPLTAPNGQPMLQLGGPGEVAERQYTGTGFALAGSGGIVTNRHVAVPWEKDASSAVLAEQGMAPVMLRLAAYFPGAAKAVDMALAGASDAADLAVLRTVEGAVAPSTAKGLELAETPPLQGAEVIVMGFPTGLRSMLARTGEAFVESLKADNATEFWAVAERLAAAGHIAPLASRGIVGQTTAAAVVYDAETTHGGSGGPVLNAQGRVVAVNAAILPEYGGSNLGVPTALLRDLLRSLDGG